MKNMVLGGSSKGPRSQIVDRKILYPDLDARIQAIGVKLILRFVRIANQYTKTCTMPTGRRPGAAGVRCECYGDVCS
eukprot:COSAG06_NODE_28950_length_565_cov_0.772532_1_plen_76_part_10